MTALNMYATKANARKDAFRQKLNPADFIIGQDAETQRWYIAMTTPVVRPVSTATAVETEPEAVKAKDKAKPASAPVVAVVDVTTLRAKLDALKVEVDTVKAAIKVAEKGRPRERVSTIENPVAFIWASLNAMAKKTEGVVARKDALAALTAGGCGKNTISTQLHRWKHATPAERTARASKA
ncbi:hypothetical protein [Mesorhizobium sp. LSHC412B00]|uniref:hypothetical protein n=1 Tax=Mesorhizobium sp. LSHC412B00 TaxID=1287285 RepID=UPI0003CF9B5D|nr:hypothetical protein [Mesorhizobium sp. LSHC412B00]ESX91362.1 hypothetical protein X756_04340 [Mesorhizobium sp. LSHC412B00]